MGNICADKEQTSTRKPRKCSKCLKTQGSQVLTAFDKCSHLICRECIMTGEGNQFVCPLGPDKSNIMVQLGRQLYSSMVRSSQDEQLCSRKHKMVWRDQFDQCSICHTHMHGFKCRLCNQSICTLCSKIFNPHYKKCPNRHPLSWRSTSIPCLICGQKKHGWTCRECRWYACSNCCDTKFNPSTCPNSHSYEWKSDKQSCTICKSKERVFQCNPCGLLICHTCCGYAYQRSKCPNKHDTRLAQRGVCSKCELQSTGMWCEECSYLFCTKCDLEKYSTVAKNPTEAYTSVKVMFENPLLQFEQKTNLAAVKQAGARAARLTVPEIQIKENQQNNSFIDIPEIELIKKQIKENPGQSILYLKLAEVYYQLQNFQNEINAYQEGLKCELLKEDLNPLVLYKIFERAALRTIQLTYRNSALTFISKIIDLSFQYPEVKQIQQNLQKWRLLKAQQLVLSKYLPLAQQEFKKCQNHQAPEYKRLKQMLEKETKEQSSS